MEGEPESNTYIGCVSAGEFGMQGHRSNMEDTTTVLIGADFDKAVGADPKRTKALCSFVGVYDGHGGKVCAQYCQKHVHLNMAKNPNFGRDDAAALKQCLRETDRMFCEACSRMNLKISSGSTAICAFIDRNRLFVANVGDSRAVLSRRGKPKVLSEDHKPDMPRERQRIEELGGQVAITEAEAQRQCANGGRRTGCCGKMFLKAFIPNRPLRVFPGGLSVSRALGDVGMKTTGLIISTPEIRCGRLKLGDEFIILACDGVWDVIKNQKAVDIVRKVLGRDLKGDPTAASKALAEEAFSRGSMDNITVTVVVFGPKDATGAFESESDRTHQHSAEEKLQERSQSLELKKEGEPHEMKVQALEMESAV